MKQQPILSIDPDTSCCTTREKSYTNEQTKRALANRLSRIEGQVRGVKAMIDKNTYCNDVLNQIAAVQSALHGVSRILLKDHMKNCVMEQIREGDEQVLDELFYTLKKLMK